MTKRKKITLIGSLVAIFLAIAALGYFAFFVQNDTSPDDSSAGTEVLCGNLNAGTTCSTNTNNVFYCKDSCKLNAFGRNTGSKHYCGSSFSAVLVSQNSPECKPSCGDLGEGTACPGSCIQTCETLPGTTTQTGRELYCGSGNIVKTANNVRCNPQTPTPTPTPTPGSTPTPTPTPTPGSTPTPTPQPTIVCGNGSKESGEMCDDGNKTDGDSCSASCTYELTVGTLSCSNQDSDAALEATAVIKLPVSTSGILEIDDESTFNKSSGYLSGSFSNKANVNIPKDISWLSASEKAATLELTYGKRYYVRYKDSSGKTTTFVSFKARFCDRF